MSGFFNSELVRNDIKELEKLQKKLYQDMMYVPFYDKEQKREHLILMKKFLEKQKIFIFRLSLSNDPEVIEIKEHMLDSVEFLGFDKKKGFDSFFKMMERTINGLEKSLDD